jgi:tellurite resistance protein TerC
MLQSRSVLVLPRPGHRKPMLIELSKQGYRLARRIVIATIGGTVVLLGLVMLVTPGPALLVIPIGLAILAVEFAWARYWLQRLKATINKEQFNSLVRRGFGLRSDQPPVE